MLMYSHKVTSTEIKNVIGQRIDKKIKIKQHNV